MHDSSTATLNDVDYHQVEEKSGQIGVLKLNNHQVDYLQLDNYQLDYHRRDYHKEDYHQQKKKCQVTSGSTVGKWFVINSCNKFLISSVGLASLHIFVFCDLWFVIRKVVAGLLFTFIIGGGKAVLLLYSKYWIEEYQTLYPGWLKALHEDRSE